MVDLEKTRDLMPVAARKFVEQDYRFPHEFKVESLNQLRPFVFGREFEKILQRDRGGRLFSQEESRGEAVAMAISKLEFFNKFLFAYSRSFEIDYENCANSEKLHKFFLSHLDLFDWRSYYGALTGGVYWKIPGVELMVHDHMDSFLGEIAKDYFSHGETRIFPRAESWREFNFSEIFLNVEKILDQLRDSDLDPWIWCQLHLKIMDD